MGDWAEGRNRKWEATHERIYDVAVALFTDEGFEQVSVASIAAAAGVSVQTFYAHYPSKEHVVMNLLLPEQIATLFGAPPADRTLGERISETVVGAMSAFDTEQRAQLLTRWRIIAGTPSLRHRVGEFDRVTALMVAESRTGGGPVRPVDLVIAGAYFSAMTTALLGWADGDGERDLRECLVEAFDVLAGAGADPG
ncbi:TetR/AcrR family transcriptional regulator [Blastococcus sp. TF02-8]|uniref:TetR/AcrR family transcriptional regulator n=1 Tax=Blastococcus sp. TF02-8 TaxID=2250574 RepID=UPI0014123AED|nr:TetR family transcriptional regulator [Blastococcus sp. TF02-8]